MTVSTQDVINAIRTVLPEETRRYELHEPYFSGNERSYLEECINTNWVSSGGPHVGRFEKALAEHTGVKHAVATVNGTSALHMCVVLAGVTAGDEVLLPAFTFVATANAVSYAGAIPHFIDIEEHYLTADAEKLEQYLRENADIKGSECFSRSTGRRIKALIAMHTFGVPCEMQKLSAVCKEFGITLLEDAAQSLGSYDGGSHTGTFGLASALSFNGNKIITTGGGGMILTNDEELGIAAKHLTTTAKLPHPWRYFHDQIGYNYRLPNVNAAIGLAQMESLPEVLSLKSSLASRYETAFRDMSGVRMHSARERAISNNWLNTLIFDDISSVQFEGFLDLCCSLGIMVRPSWVPLNNLPMYKNCPSMQLDVTEKLSKRVVSLPSSAFLALEAEVN